MFKIHVVSLSVLLASCGNAVDGPDLGPRSVPLPAPSAATGTDDCAPQPPAPEPTAYNILVRGQSNALLFVEWGGAWVMRTAVAQALGIEEDAIHVIADWSHPQGHNTINSGTGFIADWMDGETPRELETGLLAAIADMSPDAKRNPTLILWMHNEYDQQHEGLDEATWLTSARADGELVRNALGQPPSRTPYFYVWVPYGYASGGAPEAIRAGMNTLVEDTSFNAHWGTDIQQSDMGDASHMSDDGSDAIGARIAPEVAEILRQL